VITVVSARSWRWAAPVVVAVGIGSGIGINGAMSANASPTLPAKTPAALLSDMQTAHVGGFSGTVVQHADLGLPALPSGLGGRGSSDLSSLITGSHTMRVWYDGPGKIRLALLGTLGESDLIRNNNNLWNWSSKDNAVTHYALPAEKKATEKAPAGTPLTPQQAAQKALSAISPTTKVTTDGTVSVAGRSAYQLVIAPRDAHSLVASVKVAVDAATHEPLRVQIMAKGHSAPAVEVGFSQVSFSTPSATQFQFTAPKGATVKQGSLEGIMGQHQPARKAAGSQEPTIIGKGWTQVVVVKDFQLPTGKSAGQLGSVLHNLPRVSGSWGSGRLLSSTLVNALITDDGRLIAGAVPADQLYAAAAHK
jgi:outer membrane lipoprotein-sorting protein